MAEISAPEKCRRVQYGAETKWEAAVQTALDAISGMALDGRPWQAAVEPVHAPSANKHDGPWVAAGEPVLGASAAHPNCGNYIYIKSHFSVMGRAGHSINQYNLIADNSHRHRMQQV